MSSYIDWLKQSLRAALIPPCLPAQIEKLASSSVKIWTRHGGGGGCNWQTTDVTSVKFLCPVAEGMREWGMLNFQTYDALQHQSKDFSDFILVIQQSISSHTPTLPLAMLTRHTPPLSLLLSPSLALNDIQVSTLTADWCILQLFLTLASGLRLKNCQLHWRHELPEKILVQNVWKSYTDIYLYIPIAIGVCVCV